MYYLGIDGGGSKTAFLITDEAGHTVAEGVTEGCSYPQIGIHGVARVISDKLELLFHETGLEKSDIKGAAVGLPCYGEDRSADEELKRTVTGAIALPDVCICNDVELGWAGSLGLEAGVHVVAGTGAIAYGRNRKGNRARSNGWHEDFSDEGSGYWLGMQALALFARQADGRMERSVLYERMQEALGITCMEELVPLYGTKYKGNRKKIAALQMTVFEAAKDGDANAVMLYEKAAGELAASIRAVASKLEFGEKEPIPVSYSGGVFQVGEYIMKPLREMLDGQQFHFRAPLLKPVQGGILLAAAHAAPDQTAAVRSALIKNAD